ncbi:hypothetical protein KIL84_021220 [Mauremys mutica]|uniref:Uncharacterized protein n=1 Tax=Mauremys mutica TaxID=74926 RepID=A0A9D3XBC1_9SAUR|nr:hypothetical protein KIL84_021220 [Mauremys mutica]
MGIGARGPGASACVCEDTQGLGIGARDPGTSAWVCEDTQRPGKGSDWFRLCPGLQRVTGSGSSHDMVPLCPWFSQSPPRSQPPRPRELGPFQSWLQASNPH